MSLSNRTTTPLGRRSFLNGSVVALGAAVFGPALLAGCASSDSPETAGSSDGGKQELAKMTFLSFLPMETFSMVPEMMGLAGGYFEKHGLDVEVQVVKGSPQAMQTLISGVAPITRVNAADIYTAVADKDMPLVNIGTLVRGSTIRIIYSKDAPLNSPQDFVGKTIGVPSEGGSSDKTLSLMLANAGIDPTEVKRQVVGLTPATFELVKKGTLAGYMVSPDTALIAEKQDPKAAIYSLEDAVKSDSQEYISTPDQIEKDGENLKKYLAAIKDAIGAIIADKEMDETIKTLRTKYNFATLMDDDIAKKALTIARDSWTLNGKYPDLLVTDKDYWAAGYEELVRNDMVPGGHDPKEWADNSLLS